MRTTLSIHLSLLLTAYVLVACYPVAPPEAVPSLRPGDQIDGMGLMTGARDVPPLWAFCGLFVNSRPAGECHVPALPKLAIGHTLGLADDALLGQDWTSLTWEFYVDDHPLDLDAFGVVTFALPTLAHHPSYIREVFIKAPAWDVVLTDLKPGTHTVRGLAQVDTTFSWNVSFTVDALDEP